MSFLKVTVDDSKKELVEALLIQLGCEVTEQKKKEKTKKSTQKVSPTLLFGKWKNIDIDPVTFRKELWGRRK